MLSLSQTDAIEAVRREAPGSISAPWYARQLYATLKIKRWLMTD